MGRTEASELAYTVTKLDRNVTRGVCQRRERPRGRPRPGSSLSGLDAIVVACNRESAGLWERSIPGQLRLPLEHATRPLIAARRPTPTRPEWASRAATGGLVLCYRDPDADWRGAARWYGVHLQDRLDGGVDVIRRWGRLGVRSTRPRQLAEPYPDWTAARGGLEELLARRAARGYRWA